MRSWIYADYAAAAPLRPAASAAMRAVLASGAGNPSSVHWAGTRARALLEAAREEVAAAIGAHPLEIVFTSGATEANNLAIAGSAAADRSLRLAAPATEHSSVLEPLSALAARGQPVTVLPVSENGRTAPADVAHAAPDLFSIALVNAETGVIQECAALGAEVHAGGGRLHVDAAQAPGHVGVGVDELGADLLTLSSPKVGGPLGAGALFVREGTPLVPLLRGGPQERGLRAGTENLPAIAGFAAALTAAIAEWERENVRLAALVGRLERGVAALDPAARFAGGAPTRAGHVLNVTFPDLGAEGLVAALDLEGIAVSAGSACAAGAATPSHVLEAMGWTREDAAAAVRFSFGWASTAADVEGILRLLPLVLTRARARVSEAAWPARAS